MGRAQRRQQLRRPTLAARPATWLRSITGAAALLADPLNAEQATPGPRALAARTIQHSLTLLADAAGLLEAGEPPERVLELFELRLSELATRLSPTPTLEAPTMPMPTPEPTPMTALERAWRHVYPTFEPPSAGLMLDDLRRWARELYPELVAQAAAHQPQPVPA